MFQVTGKKLLEKGELKRRYTIIPLNKISASRIAPETLRIAQNLVRFIYVLSLFLQNHKILLLSCFKK